MPSDIIELPASGTGNMGTLTDSSIKTARFTNPFPGEWWQLLYLRVLFNASGDQADSATMQLRLDSHLGVDGQSSVFDWIVETWLKMGYDLTDADANISLYWVPRLDEQRAFFVHPLDDAVLTWTDPATTGWAVALGAKRAVA